MKISTQNSPASKRLSAVFAFATLLVVASQAAGQQPQAASQQQRGRIPDMPSRNDGYQVWVGLNMADYLPSSDRQDERFPEIISDQESAIAGIWSNAEFPGLELALQMDGNFSLTTNVNLEKHCSAGVERGRWNLAEETSQVRFYIKTDTNGACGLSDPNVAGTLRMTDAGLLLIMDESSATTREMLLTRR